MATAGGRAFCARAGHPTASGAGQECQECGGAGADKRRAQRRGSADVEPAACPRIGHHRRSRRGVLGTVSLQRERGREVGISERRGREGGRLDMQWPSLCCKGDTASRPSLGQLGECEQESNTDAEQESNTDSERVDGGRPRRRPEPARRAARASLSSALSAAVTTTKCRARRPPTRIQVTLPQEQHCIKCALVRRAGKARRQRAGTVSPQQQSRHVPHTRTQRQPLPARLPDTPVCYNGDKASRPA